MIYLCNSNNLMVEMIIDYNGVRISDTCRNANDVQCD